MWSTVSLTIPKANGSMVEIRPISLPRLVTLRLLPASDADLRAVAKGLGIELPLKANQLTSGLVRVARLARDEWLIRGGPPVEDLQAALAHTLCNVTDISAGRAGWAIAGTSAADLVNAGCSLDLRPTVFMPGSATRTVMAQIQIILSRTGNENGFEIITDGSHQAWFQSWLDDAAGGLAQ